jgi:hypothetical protein
VRKLGFVLTHPAGPQRSDAQSVGGERFDGKWLTKPTCASKGNTEGYHWQLSRRPGATGDPGFLLIEDKIAEDGGAMLSATGIVSSRKYAHGVSAHKGEEYGKPISQRTQAQGAGTQTSHRRLPLCLRDCETDCGPVGRLGRVDLPIPPAGELRKGSDLGPPTAVLASTG